VTLSCGRFWGHDGAVPGYFTNVFASEDGKRAALVFANRQPLDERQTAVVGRTLDKALCS
jgi:D-alanyl-D-alanine carboxypeptidase